MKQVDVCVVAADGSWWQLMAATELRCRLLGRLHALKRPGPGGDVSKVRRHGYLVAAKPLVA